MLWSIDSCQNRVSADQHHLTVSRAQASTHRVWVFFLKLSADKLLVFKWSQAQICFLKICMKYVMFMTLWPSTIKILISNWPRTRKFSQFFKNTGGKTFFTIDTRWSLCVQFLCSDWSKFDRWVHAENLRSILKVVYFDSLGWSLQSFVSTCDVFDCLFPLDVQNEIQLLSRVFCDSWLVCLFGFRFRNASRQNSVVRFRMASFLVFTLLDARGFKSLKQLWPSLIAFRNWISNGKPE